MALSMTEIQKRLEKVQEDYGTLEVAKSKAQEEVYKCMHEQQKLTTELNELIIQMNSQKVNTSGIALPGQGFNVKKGPHIN